MTEKILTDYETFEEFPNGKLLVNKNSNLIYIKLQDRTYITREFVNEIIIDGENAEYRIEYYNVQNNEKVFTLNVIKQISNNSIKYINNRNIYLVPLSQILNIKGNSIIYLDFDDINRITEFKSEEPIQKRKYYF